MIPTLAVPPPDGCVRGDLLLRAGLKGEGQLGTDKSLDFTTKDWGDRGRSETEFSPMQNGHTQHTQCFLDKKSSRKTQEAFAADREVVVFLSWKQNRFGSQFG